MKCICIGKLNKGYMKVKTFFSKLNIKESYKYKYVTHPIYITHMEKTN